MAKSALLALAALSAFALLTHQSTFHNLSSPHVEDSAFNDTLFWVIGPSEGLARVGMSVKLEQRAELYKGVAPGLNRAMAKNIDEIFQSTMEDLRGSSSYLDSTFYFAAERLVAASNKRQARNRANAAARTGEKGSPTAVAGQIALDLIAYAESSKKPFPQDGMKRIIIGVGTGAVSGEKNEAIGAVPGSVLGGLLGATSSFMKLPMD